MRHIPVEPPAFFHRGPSPLARLAFFGLISIALLFLDTRYRYLEDMRHLAAIVLYPLQRAAQIPGEALGYVGSYFASQRALSDENASLKRQLVEQSIVARALPETQQENARLKALLGVRARYGAAATAVEVLYTGRDAFTQKLFVGKDGDADLKAGEAVVDVDGVVGQVTRVFPYMVEVTLITDKDQAVPVKVERSGVRSVLFGSGAGHAPELRFMAPNADIQVGDRLVTSGIDGVYPAGLPVATVVRIERDAEHSFARVVCKPAAGVDRGRFVLVLTNESKAPPRPEETQPGKERRPDKTRRGRPKDAVKDGDGTR